MNSENRDCRIDGSAAHDSRPAGASEREWLDLHAADLIERLQAWASDLDAREALVAARAAMQKHREREFRIRRKRILADLASQRQSLERLAVAFRSQPSPPVSGDDSDR